MNVFKKQMKTHHLKEKFLEVMNGFLTERQKWKLSI